MTLFFRSSCLALCLCVCACSPKKPADHQVQDAAPLPTEKSTDTQNINTKGTVVHKEGKPGAAVNLISPTIIEIAVNQPVTTVIELATPSTTGVMYVDWTVSEGLQLISTETKAGFSLSEKPELKIPVEIKAAKEGRFYLNLQIAINDGEITKARSISIIIQAGNPQPAAMLEKTVNPSGEHLKVMPAQETTSP